MNEAAQKMYDAVTRIHPAPGDVILLRCPKDTPHDARRDVGRALKQTLTEAGITGVVVLWTQDDTPLVDQIRLAPEEVMNQAGWRRAE